MMSSLRFVDRVVIVTGAGGGLGRAYAIEFANRGAKVIVNDLGGDAHGTRSSTSMADKVVKEIRATGGTAIANYDSVEFGDKIVRSAINSFGRIDVIVNNAGILRDKSLQNMSELDWDLIYKVHLKGAFSLTKAAWSHFRKQRYGRIIVTSSNSGIYGNFGQINYSAAKSALIGFSHSVALEGAKYNVQSNVVVPTAGSRLTEDILPPDVHSALKPACVVPLVVFLSHHTCSETGKIFEAAGGWFGEVLAYRSKGVVIPNATPEEVSQNIEAIKDMTGAKHFSSLQEVIAELMETSIRQQSTLSSHSYGGSTQHRSQNQLKSSFVFEEIARTLREHPELAAGVNAIVLYVFTNSGKEIAKITLDMKNSPPRVYEGDVQNGEKANTTVTVDDDDFTKIAGGELNPQKAFMAGKLKVKGNIMLLQKLQTIMQKNRQSKL